MQNSSLYSQIKAQVQQPQPPFPEQEHLKCPRCDSTNTKFCYYNNYNLSQPRHFCKSCRRYWTKGGALRNIPIGGGSRKNTKRSFSSSSSSPVNSTAAKRPAAAPSVSASTSKNKNGDQMAETLALKGGSSVGQFGNFLEVSGSFSSLLGPSGAHFGGTLLDGLGHNGSSWQISDHFGDPGSGRNVDPQVGLESGSSSNVDGFLNIQGSGSNVFPDLAIYTPGSFP